MFARFTACAVLLSAVLVSSPGCGGDALGDCPPNSENQQLSGGQIIFFTCIGCHHSDLEGEAREDAPVGTDYDDLDIVRRDAAEIYEYTRDLEMPPNQPLNARQIEDLRVYLACGADVNQPQQ